MLVNETAATSVPLAVVSDVSMIPESWVVADRCTIWAGVMAACMLDANVAQAAGPLWPLMALK